MKEKAEQLFNEGYNCSQCILKAGESSFGVPISKSCIRMCGAVNTGFGIGEICSVLIAGIMLFGLLFDQETAKRLRLKLLDECTQKYGKLSCGYLKSSEVKSGDCGRLIYELSGLIEQIIRAELG